MEVMLGALCLVIGLIFGSFFNVVGLRVPEGRTFVNGRSACPKCNHTLGAKELIPVMSYIWLRGKCRHCETKIPLIYPAVELATGFLFAFSAYMIGFQLELITALLLVSLLMIVLVSDLTYMIIPNKVLLFFFPLMVIMRIAVPLDPWWSPIAGGIGGLLLLALIIVISKGGMGAGDMKLFGILGIVFGFKKMLLAFLLSTVIGALIGVVLVMSEAIKRQQHVPFGPYIVLGALITYFYGDFLANWYFDLLF